MKNGVEKSSKSDVLKIWGIVTILMSTMMLVILIPSVSSMADYKGDSIQEKTVSLLCLIARASMFTIAGLSTFVFKKSSFYLYVCSLVFTLFYLLTSLYIYCIPLVVSSIGIVLSRERRKKSIEKHD